MEFKTTYMGLQLRNPIVVGASNLSADIEMVRKFEEAGAAAVVYKSLFEEQLHLEAAELDDDLVEYADRNAEMISLFPKVEHSGPKAHLLALKKLKESVQIPVIASINCLYDVSWVDYARHLEATGADALELNFYHVQTDLNRTSQEIEDGYIEILRKVKAVVAIPVGVKLSPYFSNVLNLAKRLSDAGASGVVLFNRLFQPDVDVAHEAFKMPYNLSHKGDARLTLRYTGMLYNEMEADVCANNGIMDGEDLVAMLLAGATSVQVVSTLYKNGPIQITRMLETLGGWMKEKGYANVNEFKGKLSKKNIQDPYAYHRAQYVDFLMKSKNYLEKYPL